MWANKGGISCFGEGITIKYCEGRRITMEYCEDCKWFKYGWVVGKEYGRCRHPGAKTTSRALVSRKYAPFASSEREYGHCGKEAQLFEPRGHGFWH